MINFMRSCLILGLAAFAMNNTAQAETQMTAAEVMETMSGNTAVAPRRAGEGYYYLYRGDGGYQAMKSDNGFSDQGKWRVTDDGQVCSTWRKMRDGEERCVTLFSLGDNRYKFVRPDGSAGEFEVVSGNPKRL